MNASSAQSLRLERAADAAGATDIDQEVRAAEVDVLYHQLPTGMAATAVTAVALALLIAPHVERGRLVAWLTAVLVVSALRAALWLVRHRQARPAPGRWCHLAVAGAFASGLLWGIAPVALPAGDGLLAPMLCTFWAAGMAAGAVGTFTSVLAAWFAFAVPALLPATVLFLGSPDPTLGGLGLGAGLFLTFMGAVAVRTHRVIGRGIRLRIENQHLAARLAADHRRAEELNELLRQDLIERERAAARLRRAKQEADALAERLRAQSQRDGLTGIANRRHLDETLAREWSRARRERQTLALVLCDLDHFKAYNDTCGHQAGDECLRSVAQGLARLCRRGGDLAARYGGEEFALLLPGLDVDEAARLAERARAEIEAVARQTSRDGQPLVTASFGVAAMRPDTGLRPGLLVEAADRALYRAKAAGRNRVERQSSLGEHLDAPTGARARTMM